MQGQAVQSAQLPRRMGWKVFAVAALVLALGAFAAYALQRELRTKPETPSAGAAFTGGLAMGEQHAVRALSAEEEAYAAALWPIHSQVKLSAVRMTFAGLNYKIDQNDAAKLRATVQPLTRTFSDAAQRARRIQPPPSLKDAHRSYLEAIEHYTAASKIMIKVAEDGREEHLIAAHERSEQASHELLKLSDVLWPGEYKPN
jgi:hypothetical protein